MDAHRTGEEERVLFEHELHDQALLMRLQREALPNEFRGLPRLPSKRKPREVICREPVRERPGQVTPATWAAFGIDWTEEWT